MKALFAAAAAALLLTGCAGSEAEEETTAETTAVSTETRTKTTAAAVISSAGTRTETSRTTALQTKNPDELTEKELSDMEAVDESIASLMKNPVYQQLAFKKKAENMQKLLMKLATKGTKDAPYPLIEPLTIQYDESGQQFSFLYTCGVSGGVMLKSFDPVMN